MNCGGAASGKNGRVAGPFALELDLRGIKCPLNWAHAKVRLEAIARGEVIELTIDDPRGARDIPRAAEAEGYAVIEVSDLGGTWRLRIEK
ncbi:MAG: sulfurtransferase TusA family protein [Candidatus Binataceae bacterium]|jgi:TusA-related sulfurtransferase